MDDMAVVELLGPTHDDVGMMPQDTLRRELTLDGRVYGLLDLCITKEGVSALYAYIEDAT